jgi:hypothetical protein
MTALREGMEKLLRPAGDRSSRSQRTPTHSTARPVNARARRSCEARPPRKTSSTINPVPQRAMAARP